jgi:hypothetical protein
MGNGALGIGHWALGMGHGMSEIRDRFFLFPLPIAHCPLPHALFPLPIAHCPLPHALCPLPLISHSPNLDSIVLTTAEKGFAIGTEGKGRHSLGMPLHSAD